MIGALLLLSVLFDSSYCLSEKGRIALTKAYGGIDIDKRHERLKNLGLKGLGSNPPSEKATTSSKAKAGENTPADEGTIAEVNRREGVDEYLFNGDMILTELNKTIHLLAATNQAYVRKQLKYLSDRTCITFVESANATNRIKVFDGAGCYSFVGMIGGEQQLSLTDGCFRVGTVAHEFMHALGALHMQMRHDRDTYIKVDLTNVPFSLHRLHASTTAKNTERIAPRADTVLYLYGSK
ncbi:unnamed protein product [Haemonchus placei]|uniref:Metalloendopeptidase n=1 Tax=Haemonchus placei TaxID=6290 RepID=A0A0N4WIS6_HAEPC|nr:unnamed protein product [Haemonchus placei]